MFDGVFGDCRKSKKYSRIGYLRRVFVAFGFDEEEFESESESESDSSSSGCLGVESSLSLVESLLLLSLVGGSVSGWDGVCSLVDVVFTIGSCCCCCSLLLLSTFGSSFGCSSVVICGSVCVSS